MIYHSIVLPIYASPASQPQVSAMDPDLSPSSNQNILYYLSPDELRNFTIGSTSGNLSINGVSTYVYKILFPSSTKSCVFAPAVICKPSFFSGRGKRLLRICTHCTGTSYCYCVGDNYTQRFSCLGNSATVYSQPAVNRERGFA